MSVSRQGDEANSDRLRVKGGLHRPCVISDSDHLLRATYNHVDVKWAGRPPNKSVIGIKIYLVDVFRRKSTGILARQEMISPDSRSLFVDLPIKA